MLSQKGQQRWGVPDQKFPSQLRSGQHASEGWQRRTLLFVCRSSGDLSVAIALGITNLGPLTDKMGAARKDLRWGGKGGRWSTARGPCERGSG
jgi:hypothetical protein